MIVAVEAYLYEDPVRTADAFPTDRCLETATLLEEFAKPRMSIKAAGKHRLFPGQRTGG